MRPAATSHDPLGDLRAARRRAGNRAAARDLLRESLDRFVTQRTVENHLTSAYAKLGITARPELAAVPVPAGPSQARRTAPASR